MNKENWSAKHRIYTDGHYEIKTRQRTIYPVCVRCASPVYPGEKTRMCVHRGKCRYLCTKCMKEMEGEEKEL
jgi:hypothetical protein